MDIINVISRIPGFIKDHSAVLGLFLGALSASGIFAFSRKGKSKDKKDNTYFVAGNLLTPPLKRPAYSDRMAYVMAELSDLAYYDFESAGGLIDEAVSDAQKTKIDLNKNVNLERFLDKFSDDLLVKKSFSVGFMDKILMAGGFKLVKAFSIDETQGFVCERAVDDELPYLVIAFRGTEKKIQDWLTDLNAKPHIDGDKKVHTGFLKAFSVTKGGKLITAKESGYELVNYSGTVEMILKDVLKERGVDKSDGGVPVYITGHSLGGALAMLTTRCLVPNINGACYTFGAPRVANYEYFENVKTPVYRVVNSSDIVPRVPPGAGTIILLKFIQILSWSTGFFSPASNLFDKLENALDKLKGYRHFGDLRYLTDVAVGRFQEVKLLRNPPMIDRILWVWSYIRASFLMPVKSHSMYIYRKKLLYIANDRNGKVN